MGSNWSKKANNESKWYLMNNVNLESIEDSKLIKWKQKVRRQAARSPFRTNILNNKGRPLIHLQTKLIKRATLKIVNDNDKGFVKRNEDQPLDLTVDKTHWRIKHQNNWKKLANKRRRSRKLPKWKVFRHPKPGLTEMFLQTSQEEYPLIVLSGTEKQRVHNPERLKYVPDLHNPLEDEMDEEGRAEARRLFRNWWDNMTERGVIVQPNVYSRYYGVFVYMTSEKRRLGEEDDENGNWMEDEYDIDNSGDEEDEITDVEN